MESLIHNGLDLTRVQPGEQVTVDTSSRDELRLLSQHLVSRARRRIDIYSRELDPPIYDTEAFVTAVRALCTEQRRAQVRIIVQDTDRLRRQGHGLLRLAHRLTSFIELRQPAPEHRTNNFALLVIDEIACIHREMADRYEATISFGDRSRAQSLMNQFELVWEHASQPPDLRRLTL